MIYKPVVDIIKDVVDSISIDIPVFYDYGTTLEVTNRLRLKTDSDNYFDKKYPLIWYVIGDSVKEEVDNKKAIRRKAVSNSIIICTETKSEYTSEERYSNVIKPILRPIYEAFMYQLKLNKELKSPDGFSHDYYENLFWGKNGLYGHEGNIFNDKIDAIIIDSLDLLIIENC